jgi:hypothetical protein
MLVTLCSAFLNVNISGTLYDATQAKNQVKNQFLKVIQYKYGWKDSAYFSFMLRVGTFVVLFNKF